MRARKVNQFAANGTLVATFKTIREAADAAGVSDTLICNCLTGKQKKVGGFTYQYADQARGSQTRRPSDEPLKLYERLKNYALSLCHCTDMAEDLVQEAYTSYYEKFVEESNCNAYTFLASSIKWQFYNEVECHKNDIDYDAMAYCISSEEVDMEERLDLENRADLQKGCLDEMIGKAVSTIKTEKRRTRILRIYHWYLDGMGATEISEKLHCKVQSAKQEIFRMRRFVSEALDIPMREFTQYNCGIA